MWRSLLFVPILNKRLVQSAAKRKADVVVLDLEAAVPIENKDEARQQVTAAVTHLNDQGVSVGVRINPPGLGEEQDINALCRAGVEIIVIPKASVTTMVRIAELIKSNGIAGNSSDETFKTDNVKLIPLIEDPRGVFDALNIAEAVPCVAALGFGVEDYASEMGTSPTPELLEPAGFQVIQAARAAGCEALVILDTIANYKDINRFRTAAKKSRLMGASGSFAIHPAQVDVLNNVFTPDAAEVEAAKRIVDAAERARQQGQAVATLDGQMIDAPVELRAKNILRRSEELGS